MNLNIVFRKTLRLFILQDDLPQKNPLKNAFILAKLPLRLDLTRLRFYLVAMAHRLFQR